MRSHNGCECRQLGGCIQHPFPEVSPRRCPGLPSVRRKPGVARLADAEIVAAAERLCTANALPFSALGLLTRYCEYAILQRNSSRIRNQGRSLRVAATTYDEICCPAPDADTPPPPILRGRWRLRIRRVHLPTGPLSTRPLARIIRNPKRKRGNSGVSLADASGCHPCFGQDSRNALPALALQ